MEIAVFQDVSGKTQCFFEPGIIKIYAKYKEKWEVTKEVIFRIDDVASLKSVRESIRSMAEALGECKVFVGREVKGVPYTVLDGLGFNTWELEGVPTDFLDFVLQKEEEEVKATIIKNSGDQLYPIEELANGKYFLNLKKYQENNIDLSSKAILLPFLNNTTFYELQIICGHIPPWFESEFKKLNLESQNETITTSEIKVTVYPKICE